MSAAMPPHDHGKGVESWGPERVQWLVSQLLDEGLTVEIPVTGSSMWPFLQSGDIVTLAPASLEEVRPGDVVAFVRSNRRLVIHRVVGTSRDGALTRGDAVGRSTETVAEADLIARAIRVDRDGHRALLGIGPERHLLALLSRLGWLTPALLPWRLARRLARRFEADENGSG